MRDFRTADQRFRFRYTDSTISLLPKYESTSIWLSFVVVQPVLFRTWSETQRPYIFFCDAAHILFQILPSGVPVPVPVPVSIVIFDDGSITGDLTFSVLFSVGVAVFERTITILGESKYSIRHYAPTLEHLLQGL